MYTENEEKFLAENYDGCNVKLLAAELNKSERSIIGKLSKMGIYQRKEYVTKTGERPISKLELVSLIAGQLQCQNEDLNGLDKSPKQTLKFLLERMQASGAGRADEV